MKLCGHAAAAGLQFAKKASWIQFESDSRPHDSTVFERQCGVFTSDVLPFVLQARRFCRDVIVFSSAQARNEQFLLDVS